MSEAWSFKAPAVAARPQLRWWWPGGAVQPAVLVDQLRALHARGFGGVEIQPFKVGLPHRLPDALAAQVDDYATPAFFDKVGAVMDEARRLGMTVDLTFGSCWPFGGGEAITPELAATEVTLAWTTVHGPARYQGRPAQPARPLRSATALERQGALPAHRHLPPGWAERIAAREQIVAVIALKGSPPALGAYPGFVPISLPDAWGQVSAPGWIDPEATQDLTDRLQPDGTLDWAVPPGEWQLVVCKRFVIDQVLGEAAGAGPQLVADHLNEAAFQAHARRVGDAAMARLGEHAGGAWRAVFVDSLEIQADLHWCDDFEAEFLRRRGYALRPWLPLALQPGWRNAFQARKGPPLFDAPGVGERVRADYRRTVSELMLARCYAPFAAWAAARGLQSRTQAHGAPVDWLEAYGLASLPETEDLMGGGAPGFLRVARSAAHLHGRPLVSSEAFVWLLEGLAVTPRQVRERADALFAAGVQQIVGHGAAYPLPLPADAQGRPTAATWYPWQDMEFSTQLDPASPLWPHLGPLTDYLARCQAALRLGEARVPVAVLAPLDLYGFDSAGARATDAPWDQALQDAGHDWNWLNADGLLRCRWQDGALHTPGGHRYEAVLLPPSSSVRAEVICQLACWARAGLPVLALEAWPRRHEGLHEAAPRDAEVARAVEELVAAGAPCVPQAEAGRGLNALGLRPALDWQGATGLRFIERRCGAARLLWLHNPGPGPRAVSLRLRGVRQLQQWDAWQGEARPLPLAQDGQGGTVALQLPAGRALLLWGEPVQAPSVQVPGDRDPVLAARPLQSGPWRVQLDGRGQRGRHIAQALSLDTLCDLSRLPGLDDFAGQAHYDTEFTLEEALPPGSLLDLGEVRDVVTLRIDEGPASTACEPPFHLALRQGLAAGRHRLRLSVANVAENALRDARQPGGLPLPGRRLTRLPAGLLGPLRWRGPAPGERPPWQLTTMTPIPEAAAADTP